MKRILLSAAALTGLLSLAACEVAQTPPHPAEVACLDSVRGVGGSGASVLSRDTFETDSVVLLGDGTRTWRCRAANDGFVTSLNEI